MIDQIDAHLSRMKEELVAELSATVATAIHQMAEEMRRSGPDAVSRKEACRRLGFGLTKLKAMISRGQIRVCMGDPSRIPMSEIRRFTQPARPLTKKRGQSRKPAAFNAADEAEAGRLELRARRR